MNKPVAFLFLSGAVLGGTYFYLTKDGATIMDVVKSLNVSNDEFLANANGRAFLKMIRQFESGDNYQRLSGGGTFHDMSTKPRETRHLTIVNKQNGTTTIVPTSAAGAYQFINATWDIVAKREKLFDFSPLSQDIGAVSLIRAKSMLRPIMDGDFKRALSVMSSEWSSLPSSTAGQNPQTLQRALAVLAQNGGVVV